MELSYNGRLLSICEYLKASKELRTYTAFGEIIGENKAGINDLKNERKKVTIEHISRLKKTYPQLNTDYLIGLSDEMLLDPVASTADTPPIVPDSADQQQEIIAVLRETIASKNETIAALKALLK